MNKEALIKMLIAAITLCLLAAFIIYKKIAPEQEPLVNFEQEQLIMGDPSYQIESDNAIEAMAMLKGLGHAIDRYVLVNDSFPEKATLLDINVPGLDASQKTKDSIYWGNAHDFDVYVNYDKTQLSAVSKNKDEKPYTLKYNFEDYSLYCGTNKQTCKEIFVKEEFPEEPSDKFYKVTAH